MPARPPWPLRGSIVLAQAAFAANALNSAVGISGGGNSGIAFCARCDNGRPHLGIGLSKPTAKPVDFGVPLGNRPGDHGQSMLGRRRMIAEQRRRRPVPGHVRPGPEVKPGGKFARAALQLAAPAHGNHDHAAEDHGGSQEDDNGHNAIVPRPAAC